MAIDFAALDKATDLEGLKADINTSESFGSGDYEEVPVGKYEVKIEKMELGESKSGKPMFKAMFRIVSGDFKKSCLFMNQVITQRFQIKQLITFLQSLEVFENSADVEFTSYSQFNDLIMDMMEDLERLKLEYLLEYTKHKDFPVYKIEEVYEPED